MRSILFLTSLLAATPAAAQVAPTAILDIDYDLADQAVAAGQDRSAGHQMESVPAPQGDGISIEISETIRTGRPFRKQGMNLTDRITSETSVNISGGGLGCMSFNIWHAENGRKDLRETDLSATCSDIGLGGGFTASLQTSYYFLPGRDAIQGMVTIEHPISQSCDIGVSFEKIILGFVETTKSVQASRDELPFLGGQASGSLMAAHSSNTGRLTGSIDAGVDFELGGGFVLRPGFELFANTREQHFTAEIGIRHTF